MTDLFTYRLISRISPIGAMTTAFSLRFVIVAFVCFLPKCAAADIAWKLFLKHNAQPVYSTVTRPGEEFTIPRISLPGSDSRAQGIVDALENAYFLVTQSPDSRPIEIRITLNISGSDFENALTKPVFFNMTMAAYLDGRFENSFRFSENAPLVFFIPAGGLNYLLGRRGFSRSDDLAMAYEIGAGFTREGIVTSNLTSGLSTRITSLSTVVGSRCDILNLMPSARMTTWQQIKLLFQ